MNLASINCPCCNVTLFVQVGLAQTGKLVQNINVVVGIPWERCPDCGYSFDGIRFHTPPVQVNQKPMPKPNFEGGLRGLKG